MVGSKTVHLHQIIETYGTDENGNRYVNSRTETDMDIADDTEVTSVSTANDSTITSGSMTDDVQEDEDSEYHSEETAFSTMSQGVKDAIIIAALLISAAFALYIYQHKK